MAAFPDFITVDGICDEPGLNGVYERNGNFRNEKAQWMKPGSRCYIRWIRDRWELYVSHHPAGTTYFFHPNAAEVPPLEGWRPSEVLLPTESMLVTFGSRSDAVKSTEQVPDVGGPLSPKLSNSTPLVLWCNDTCPFVQRVSIALQELGLTARQRKVDIFGDREPEFLLTFAQACPDPKRRAAVPILEVNPSTSNQEYQLEAVTLIESRVIVEYLDESFHATSRLMPSSAAARARVRLFVDAFDRAIAPCESAVLGATDAASLATASVRLIDALGVVDHALKMYSVGDGAFLCGQLFSIAEVLCAPFLQRLVTLLPHFRKQLPCGTPMDVMLQRFPRLHAWTDAVLNRRSVVETFDLAGVVAVKSKVVANLKADFEQGSPHGKRERAAAVLEGLLQSRLGRLQ